MSERHPIIAVTGSSGAGTSTARRAFSRVFKTLGLQAAEVGGDGFHAYNREEMGLAIERARIRGENFSHFGPGATYAARRYNHEHCLTFLRSINCPEVFDRKDLG